MLCAGGDVSNAGGEVYQPKSDSNDQVLQTQKPPRRALIERTSDLVTRAMQLKRERLPNTYAGQKEAAAWRIAEEAKGEL